MNNIRYILEDNNKNKKITYDDIKNEVEIQEKIYVVIIII